MVMCSKCHKRVAVVFVNKLENGNKLSEGLCIKCARELGIPEEEVRKRGSKAFMLADDND